MIYSESAACFFYWHILTRNVDIGVYWVCTKRSCRDSQQTNMVINARKWKERVTSSEKTIKSVLIVVSGGAVASQREGAWFDSLSGVLLCGFLQFLPTVQKDVGQVGRLCEEVLINPPCEPVMKSNLSFLDHNNCLIKSKASKI